MSERLKLAGPIEGARAGFENERAKLNLGNYHQQLVAHHAALQNRVTVPADAMV
jgi:hypothetical protein